jgi:hypothetical protein
MPPPNLTAQQFEQCLREELAAAGVQTVQEFAIELEDGSRIRADLYISSPQRALVEVKVLADENSHRHIEKARSQLATMRQSFDEQTIGFMVLLNQSQKTIKITFQEDWLVVVDVSGADAAATAAASIKRILYENIPSDRLSTLGQNEFFNEIPGAGRLSNVLVNFRARIDAGAFHVLTQEAESFFKEYRSGHYTASALCIGRMVEFSVYTLANAWLVPIDKSTIAIINSLEDRFKELTKSIVQYAHIDDEIIREKDLTALKKKIVSFSALVNDLSIKIHDPQEVIETTYKINVESILRDIKRRYKYIETVGNEIDILLSDSSIRQLLDKRNRAAHADMSGTRTEFKMQDIDDMIEKLRTVFLRLGNIADAISRRG